MELDAAGAVPVEDGHDCTEDYVVVRIVLEKIVIVFFV